MFEMKRFNSGELDVKLVERLNNFEVHWNWFNEDERDLMVPLLKADAIKKQYGEVNIVLVCNYLPYSRQDRMFEVGQSVPMDVLYKSLSWYFEEIECMGLHGHWRYNQDMWTLRLDNHRFDLDDHFRSHNLVYPDKNAERHFTSYNQDYISFTKIRQDNGDVLLKLESCSQRDSKYQFDERKPYLICDDICDGGRTFVQCANELRRQFGGGIKIELIVYHAFMTHGLDDLKAAGISKIYIINPDSYYYLCNKFPEDLFYFELRSI